MMCITHAMLFFCVCKDPLNRLLASGMQIFCNFCLPQLLHQIKKLLPQLNLYPLLAFFISSTDGLAGAIFAMRGCAAVS